MMLRIVHEKHERHEIHFLCFSDFSWIFIVFNISYSVASRLPIDYNIARTETKPTGV